MCGIAGIIDPTATALSLRATAMADTLRHRGPDAGAVWVEEAAGVALAHRRLAIVDLSPAGAQPMHSADGRFVVVYNGEGYNAGELRAELQAAGSVFRGHSDTEVLCEGFSRWGVHTTLEKFNGMFAIAAWDRVDGTLHLARDRLGIKPLFWRFDGKTLLFASELKGLRADNSWPVEIDREALHAFLRHSYVPAPRTIYQGVRKLLPGHHLTVTTDGRFADEAFWNMAEVARRGIAERQGLTTVGSVDALEELLFDAVRRQMVSDVPLGAFLSGGVDSTAVVAMMQKASATPVRTFSIGFHEGDYDEAAHAAAVARHLGSDHTELYVTPQQALDTIPHLAEWWDEPFADSSQIPTLLLSQLTRQHVTVALSGDGGDELFAGYNRYFWLQTLAKTVGWLPRPARSALAAAMCAPSPTAWDNLARRLPGRFRLPHMGDKIHKLAHVLPLTEMQAYRRLVSQWPDPAELMPGTAEFTSLAWKAAAGLPTALDQMQFLDTLTYLPDDILTKVDRASMAVSLESRVPLLDHRLIEYAWSLPQSLKVRSGQGKWLLRQVVYRHVPQAMIDRPKKGFGVPIGEWLRGPLREWAESLLDPAALAGAGLVDPSMVQVRWREHLAGSRNWSYALWNVLMLESWRRRWM